MPDPVQFRLGVPKITPQTSSRLTRNVCCAFEIFATMAIGCFLLNHGGINDNTRQHLYVRCSLTSDVLHDSVD
jgi:hypothetical protein